MITRRIIPCLDVRDGRVVKGVRFRELAEVGDPAELASRYERDGADEVVFLDVAATAGNRRTLEDGVRRTAERLFIPLTVGGGVRSLGDVRRLLRCGADKVSVNTAAVRDPTLIGQCSREFGAQCMVVAIDSKREGDRHRVYVSGGSVKTDFETLDWARRASEAGAGEILLTSIDRDGTEEGYDVELTEAVSRAVTVPVIASGGCGTVDHIREVLTRGRADAALAASIFHFGRSTPLRVKEELRRQGLHVRVS